MKKKPEEEPERKQEEPKLERILTTVHHIVDDDNDKACGHCVEQQKDFDEIKKTNPSVKIKEIDFYSKEGENMTDLKGKKIDSIPYTFDCPIDPETGKTIQSECTEVKGYDKDYFSKYIVKKKDEE